MHYNFRVRLDYDAQWIVSIYIYLKFQDNTQLIETLWWELGCLCGIWHIFFQKYDNNLRNKEKPYQTLGERNGPEKHPIHHDPMHARDISYFMTINQFHPSSKNEINFSLIRGSLYIYNLAFAHFAWKYVVSLTCIFHICLVEKLHDPFLRESWWNQMR